METVEVRLYAGDLVVFRHQVRIREVGGDGEGVLAKWDRVSKACQVIYRPRRAVRVTAMRMQAPRKLRKEFGARETGFSGQEGYLPRTIEAGEELPVQIPSVLLRMRA